MAMLTSHFKAKPTHQNIIRLAPPLIITEEEIRIALKIIDRSMKELAGEKNVVKTPKKSAKATHGEKTH